MKKQALKKALALLSCALLIAAMTVLFGGCGEETKAEKSSVSSSAQSETISSSTENPEGNVLGNGATVFDFTVTDPEGKVTEFEIHTDKATVGEALSELNLISGEEGDFGIYVKTVNGITLDYDTDQKYWAFYIDGEYGMAGADMTPIEPNKTYSFKAES